MGAVADKLWNAGEVAEYLGVSRKYVEKLTRAGTIPTVPLGPRNKRYRPERIRAWLEAIEKGGK
jgi:excisionase family DNA binding protein